MQLKTNEDVVAWGNAFEARVVEQMTAQHALNARIETRLNSYSAEQRTLLEACAKLGEQIKHGNSRNGKLRNTAMVGGGGALFGVLEFLRHLIQSGG